MQQIATITGKMQLTVPATVARKAGLKKGEKVSVTNEQGKIVITPVKSIIEDLAGSVSIPRKWQGKSIDLMIQDAKREYFKNKGV